MRISIVRLSCPVRRTNFVRRTLTYLWINISCSFACLTAWNSSLWMSVKQIIHCCLQISSIYSFSLFNVLISDWILIMAIDGLISIYILCGFQNEISNSSFLIGPQKLRFDWSIWKPAWWFTRINPFIVSTSTTDCNDLTTVFFKF